MGGLKENLLEKLLQEFGDEEITPLLCPLGTTIKISADEGIIFQDPSLYRKMVAKLTFTNPRICCLAIS